MRGLILTVAAVLLAASWSWAESLVPGVYRLEWTIPERSPYGLQCVVEMKRFGAAARARPAGLVSKNALWARAGPLPRSLFTAVLDESRRTGKGYDTLYFIVGARAQSKLDLTRAVKIPVKEQDCSYVPREPGGISVPIPMGPAGSQVTKMAILDISVSVIPRGFSGPRERYEQFQKALFRSGQVAAGVELRGAWRGFVKTDSGSLSVETVDGNCNGVYHDDMKTGRGDYLRFWHGDLDESFIVGPNAWVGVPFSYQGELYVVQPSKLGDAVDVSVYPGDTGRLSVRAENGWGKPVQFKCTISSPDLGWLDVSDAGDVKVPAHTYETVKAVITAGNSRVLRHLAIHTRRTSGAVTVAKDSSTTVTLGGPVRIEIEPGQGAIAMRKGQSKTVRLALAAGDDQIEYIESYQHLKLSIQDKRGKVVMAAREAQFLDMSRGWSIRLPKSLGRGDYVVVATFDPWPYQHPATARKALKVVQ